jgi:hypothetical protein
MPKLVYWNLNARNGDSPVQFNETQTALVSGFNTNILKSLLSGDDLTPLSTMLKVVNDDRYSLITV